MGTNENEWENEEVTRDVTQADKEKQSRCCLCAIGTDEGGWKHAKDALRHHNIIILVLGLVVTAGQYCYPYTG